MLHCNTRLWMYGLNRLPCEQIFTRQNSKYQFLNTETGGNVLTEVIPSAEYNKSQKIYSNLKDMCNKNAVFLIPN